MVGYNALFKVCLFADKDVGKKTLAKSNFLKGHSEGSMRATGVDYTVKTVELHGKIIKLQFWIISDEKYHFQHIWKANIRGSLGVILMYDITNANSLNMVSERCQMVKDWRKAIPILLVGNKIDLEEQREVSKDEVDKFKEDHDISSLMEISLKTGENTEKMFMKITDMILKYLELVEEKVVHIENIFCTKCGTRLLKGALFCNNCGRKIKQKIKQ